MSILAAGKTDIGQKRSSNQDSICLLPQFHFFAVADGMGGHNGGDIASQMSAQIFESYLTQNLPQQGAQKALEGAVKHINEMIYRKGEQEEKLHGMGTTISALIFDGIHVRIANVGDSRVYLVSKGKLYQLTRDHSLVQEKLSMGFYDRSAAKADNQKNILTRTVGFEPQLEVDMYQYKVSRNDLFLICSDGLHGKVSDEDILFLVNRSLPEPSTCKQEELETLTQELIDQANRNGGQDNISVISVLAN